MSEDFDPVRAANNLEGMIRHQRSDMLEQSMLRDVKQKSQLIEHSSSQTSLIMAMVGTTLALLNVLVSVNLGWSNVWSNAVLVYLLGFGYLAGLFLVVYASAQRRNGKRRSAAYEDQARRTITDQIRLLRSEDELQELRDEIDASQRYRQGPLG